MAGGDAQSDTTAVPRKLISFFLIIKCLANTVLQRTVCTYAKQFSGSEQHDSQEFLSVILDGLHEDLNRVLNKPTIEMSPEREAELEKLPTQVASEQQWQIYRMRDDSLVVDFFQGQYRSRLECLTCHKVSVVVLSRVALGHSRSCSDVNDVQYFHVFDSPHPGEEELGDAATMPRRFREGGSDGEV